MNTRSIFALLMIMILPACSPGASGQRLAHSNLSIDEDILDQPPAPLELSIHEALMLGEQRNLDAQLSALEVLASEDLITVEKLKALPSLEASARYSGRNNLAASSSRSVIEGTQSLEPSVSSERHNRFISLEADFDTTNFAIALMQARQASDRSHISALRYEKVLSNVSRDIYSAYIRALHAQNTKEETQVLKERAKSQIDKIERASKQNDLSKTSAKSKTSGLVQLIAQLSDLQNNLDVAQIELKTLLDLPLDQELILDDDGLPAPQTIKLSLNADLNELEQEAFQKRTEIREALVNKKIAANATRQELIRTVPGINLLASLNRDSNVFLENDRWLNFSASITQQILQLANYPARRAVAENQQILEEQRYRALLLAVISQVHLSYHSLNFTADAYELAQRQYELSLDAIEVAKAQNKEGFISNEQMLSEELDAHVNDLRFKQSLHALHQAYVMFNESHGKSIADVLNIRTAAAPTPAITQGGAL